MHNESDHQIVGAKEYNNSIAKRAQRFKNKTKLKDSAKLSETNLSTKKKTYEGNKRY